MNQLATATEPYTYDGPAALVGSQGHIYVVEFSGAGIKVGMTANPTQRIRRHEKDGLVFSRPVLRRWVSAPHVEARANEKRLIAYCGVAVDPSRSTAQATEYFDHDYDDAVKFAQILPTSLGGVTESPGLTVTIGRNIRVARARLGFSQSELAAELGWSRSAVSAIETGARNGLMNDLPILCRALGLTLIDLLRDAHPDDSAAMGL